MNLEMARGMTVLIRISMIVCVYNLRIRGPKSNFRNKRLVRFRMHLQGISVSS